MTALTLTILLLAAAAARAASTSTLHRREHRQRATIHRDQGTLRFFHRHRWLVHRRATRPVAVRAIRFARAELRWTRRELAETRAALHPKPASVPAIICAVFGPAHCSEAVAVAECESRFSTSAANGQYRGIFQMGSRERALYGDGPDAWSQARAAHRYFLAAGGWGPWQCQP